MICVIDDLFKIPYETWLIIIKDRMKANIPTTKKVSSHMEDDIAEKSINVLQI